MEVAYVNVYVTELARSAAFFGETLGLPVQFSDEGFGYAAFEAGPIRLGITRIDPEDAESLARPGVQTGIGFSVPDLVASHAELAAKGVAFTMEPSRQPWGGFMAMFEDPDGNLFYLDEVEARLP